MAKAKVGPRQTTRVVTLELGEGEAETILGILGYVSGDPSRSPRKYVERIADALTDALGYEFHETDFYAHSLGHIEVGNYDEEPVSLGHKVLAAGAVAGSAGLPEPPAEVVTEILNDLYLAALER
jgi:hypothetical protein